ncbi:MAG: Bug family tripartite tricarboxylate transporter substrate binding protein [Betaproteobacteria bacterium]
MRSTVKFFLLTIAVLFCGLAHSQYPMRPVKIVVPSTAGDGSDLLARTLAKAMSESLGQSFVIENKPGAGGSIGAAVVAKSTSDGYTLFLGNGSSHGVTPGLYPRLPYDSMNDFAPVALIATAANVLVVGSDVPVTSYADFARLVRGQPGRITIASAGNGSLSHLSVELLRSMARLDLLHVPYKGAAPGIADVAGGQVQAMIINIPSVMPLIKAGKLRPLAATSSQRASSLPEVPTLSESGVKGYETLAWFGLLAPASTPRDIVTTLHGEVRKALSQLEVRETLARLGSEASGMGPEDFRTFIRNEITKYSRVIQDAGIKVE